jgi:hypothetical protein
MIILLENDDIRITVSSQTGALVGLYNKRLRSELIAFPRQTESWRLSIPYHDDNAFVVFSKDQPRPPAVREEPGRIILMWDSLHSGREVLPISVTMVFSLSGDELWTTLAIENRSEWTIEHAWFPIVGGTGELSPDGSDQLLVADSWGGRNSDLRDLYHRDWTALDWSYAQSHRYWPYRDQHLQFLYPYPLIMQWMDYFTADRGIYVNSQDNTYFLTRFWLEQDGAEKGITFAVIKSPFVRPGQRWESPVSVFAYHVGDWHVGADKYRAWFESWARQRKAPDWIRKLGAWESLQTHIADIHIQYEYGDLPTLAARCQSAGIEAIHIHCGVHREGLEGGYPFWNRYSEPMGGREALVEAIAETHATGTRLITLTKDNRVNTGLHEYETEFKRYETRFRDGSVARVSYEIGALDTRVAFRGGAQLACMCETSSEWRAFQVHEMVELVKLGLDGNMIDEWDAGKYFCFSEGHGHEHPADMIKYQMQLARSLRETTDAINPEFCYAAEEMFDATFQYFDVSFSRSFNYPGNKEHFQYTFPAFIRTMEIYENDFRRLNQAFAHGRIFAFCIRGYKGMLADFPDFAAYTGELLRLKRELVGYFRDGEFRDALELAEFVPSHPLLMVATYRWRDNSLAIVHNGAESEQRATLRWALASRHVRRLAPFQAEAVMDDTSTLAVPPQRLIVLEALRSTEV